MVLDISLASEGRPLQGQEAPDLDVLSHLQLVSPGDVITRDSGYMRGHGTYMKGEDVLHASVAGVVQRVNKLISVTPLKTKYAAEVGDVIVGRMTEVQQKRWKVETNARLDSVLQLSSVNLPGGELRRRSLEDELSMRKYLSEGDLISAEVQTLFGDGSFSLHTRSLKYGKLGQGVVVKVSPSLVKRRKLHFHALPCGVSVILGNNGYVWVAPTASEAAGGFQADLSEVPRNDRESVSRVCGVVRALSSGGVLLWDTTLITAYDVSLKYGLAELLREEVMTDVVTLTKQQIEMET